MPKGQYPFDDAKNASDDFNKSATEKTEEAKGKKAEENDKEVRYDKPELTLTPFGYSASRASFYIVGDCEKTYEDSKVLPNNAPSHSNNISFANEVRDNEIKTDVGLKSDFNQVTAQDFAPEEGAEE